MEQGRRRRRRRRPRCRRRRKKGGGWALSARAVPAFAPVSDLCATRCSNPTLAAAGKPSWDPNPYSDPSSDTNPDPDPS